MGAINWLNGIINALKTALTFQHQTDALFSQATPTQNQWYEAFSTTFNCRIITVICSVADTGEDIEARVTIDGVVLNSAYASTFVVGTPYFLRFYVLSTSTGNLILFDGDETIVSRKPFWLEGGSIKIEIRKTIANGTGTLTCKTVYAKR